MAKAIHTMIRVLDLDKSIDFYKRAFDLDVAERFNFDDFALRRYTYYAAHISVLLYRSLPAFDADLFAATHGERVCVNFLGDR